MCGESRGTCAHCVLQDKVSHYAFVASAGAYKANKVEPALTESDPRKDSAGHVAVEKFLKDPVMQQRMFSSPFSSCG